MLEFQIIISYIGGFVSMSGIILVCCLFLYMYGYKKQVDTILFSVSVSMVVTYSIKNLLHIPRPAHALVLESDGRFPSGHATIAAVCMVLIMHYSGYIKNIYMRYLARVFSIIWFFMVVYSRLYLGVHVMIDVIVGGLIGAVSTLVVIRLFSHLRYYR